MKALIFNKNNELKLVNDYEKPIPKEGEALVRVTLAGICNTDYEITKGYMGYDGILGHEERDRQITNREKGSSRN